MNSFNVHDPELNVCRSLLVEASAGTGKTYSIENIVVRALLEGKAPPTIRELLVVTFTNVAAKDLKVRIKKCLQSKKEGVTCSTTKRRLKQALIEFDQAMISTIHAFCFKALAEHSVGLQKKPDPASKEMVWEVMEHYFRVGLDYLPEQINILLKPHLNSVTDLTREVMRLMGRGLPFQTGMTNMEGLAHILKEVDAPLLEYLQTYGVCYYSFTKGKTGVPKEEHREVFEGLSKVKTLNDLAPLLEKGNKTFQLLSRTNQKPKSIVPEPVQSLFDRLRTIFFALGSYSSLLVRLGEDCRKRLHLAFDAQDACDFTYLLLKIERLISQDEEFSKRLREQFRLVIIDEFQDTDPVQWNIFHRLFLKAGIPLILVGDPKQSIYAFRSADIYTYLEAAKTLPHDAKYVLDTNYRSTPALIEALNELFMAAPGWISLPYLKGELPYHPVKPSPSKENPPDHPLEVMHVTSDLKLDQIELSYLFPYCLQEVLQLQKRGIPLSEIAFLVRDHAQSDRLFHYFSKKGLPAYQLRGVDFQKAAVLQDLVYLLRALLSPRNIGHVHAALGTCFFTWSFEKCLQLDQEGLASCIAVFYSFHHTWKLHGLGRAVQAVLSFNDSGCTVQERLAATQEGRLRFHELIQIVEWISKKEAVEDLTIEETFTELEALLDADLGSHETLKLRPLSSKQAVPILTLHASKGLEFEAVFALGVASRSPAQDEIITGRNEKGSVLQAAEKNSPAYLEYLEESDAEKARQLYVALTRAKSKLYFPVIEGWKAPALGNASPIELFLARIENIQAACPHLHIQSIPEGLSLPLLASGPPPLLYPPEASVLHLPPKIAVSYTSLARKGAVDSLGIGAPHDFNPPVFSPHTLPAGAATGELLHEILEKIPFHILQDPLLISLFIRKFVANTCYEPWEEVIAEMIFESFNQPFQGIRLNALSDGDVFREMEFMYPLKHAAAIPECSQLNGVIKGVIDLFFTFEGKYYLLDWKTNWLGPNVDAYHHESLEKAMMSHRYDLQADLYLLAIKNYLKRVDERPFEDIFGSIFYHFIRGNKVYART